MITLHENPGNTDKRLLITFGPANSGLSDKGFGTNVSTGLGVDCIYVAQRSATYYQGLNVDDFVDIMAPVLPGRSPVTYGQSLGGWCAFYYGGAINARIVGISPLNPGHPDFMRKGFATPVLDYVHKDLQAYPRSSHRPILAFDPHRADDVAFAEQFIMPSYVNMIRYEVPFAGHNILDRMKHAGSLRPFLVSVLDGKLPTSIKIPREGCSLWHLERARVFRRKEDYDASEREYRAAVDAECNPSTVTNLVAFMWQFRGADAVRPVLAELGKDSIPMMLSESMIKQLSEAGLLLDAS